MPLDPRTPVLVGVGQSSERPGDPGYAALSPIALAVAAAREALRDTGVDGVAPLIDVVATTRQFENSTPMAQAPFGMSTNFPRSVANRIGANPRRAVLEVVGGQGPQHLVNEFAGEIAAGRAAWVLIAGAEAMSTARHLQEGGVVADWSDDPGGELEDRGMALEGIVTPSAVAHGLIDATSHYALFENARPGRLELPADAYALSMGELFAPFSRVAAGNPHAVFREELDAATLTRVDERNRIVCAPYPRFLVSRDLVNQGASVLLTSLSEARRAGIAEDRLVHLAGSADLTERGLLDRPDLGSAPSAAAAVRHALDVAETKLDEIAWFDLYSCFPVAVSNVLDGLGMEPGDPRGFTLTGGLPFFGGAGNNYSAHAIAEAVHRARREPGTLGLVGANGGVLSKYSVGIYTTTPTPFRAAEDRSVQDQLDAVAGVESTDVANGPARLEAWTVRHGKKGRHAVVAGRLDADRRRFFATGDEALLALLEGPENPVGRPIHVVGDGSRNRASTASS